jgi:hypothetical protein
MKLQIAPSEAEIVSMTKQLEEMNSEYEQYKKSNQNLKVMIIDLKLKIKGIQHEIEIQDQDIQSNNSLIEQVYRDIKDIQAVQSDYNQLKTIILSLHKSYNQKFTGSTIDKSQVRSAGSQEKYNRDKDQLERHLESLNKLHRTNKVSYNRDIKKKLRDHDELKKELDTILYDISTMETRRNYIEQVIAHNGGGKLSRNDLRKLMILLGLEKGTVYDTSIMQDREMTPRTMNDSSNDWNEVKMQHERMKDLEYQLTSICKVLKLNSIEMIRKLDAEILLQEIDRKSYTSKINI